VWNEYVCTFYKIEEFSCEAFEHVNQFIGQDSKGSLWVEPEDLNLSNSSPLVLKAKEYLLTNEFKIIDQKYDKWDVLN